MERPEQISGDSKNCTGCDFLDTNYEKPFCDRMFKEIESIEFCKTGPMAKLPDRGSQMHEFMGKVELRWRRQGERHVEEVKKELNKRDANLSGEVWTGDNREVI